MYVETAASPLSLPEGVHPPAHPPAPALSPIVLDRRDLSGRRRVVAITQVDLEKRTEYLRMHADLSDLADQLLRTTTRHPDIALSEALRSSRLVTQAAQGAGSGSMTTPWVIALLDGARLLLASHGEAGAIIGEGDDTFLVPPDGHGSTGGADRCASLDPILYQTGLEVGDQVALFCGARVPVPSPEDDPRTFQSCLDQLAGTVGHLLVIDITSATLAASQQRSAVQRAHPAVQDDAAMRLRMQPVAPIWSGPAPGSKSLWTRPPAVDCLAHYRHQSPSGPGFRSRLPRGSPLSARGFLGALLVILLLVLSFVAWDFRQAQAERAVRNLPSVETALSSAMDGSDPAALALAIDDAEAVVSAAGDRGDPAQLARIRHQIVLASDQLNGTTRLINLTRVGKLPATIGDPAGAELVVAGGKLYLVAGSVFMVDAPARYLTELVTEGMLVDGRAMARIALAASDGPSLVVADGTEAHRFLDGTWRRIAEQELTEEALSGGMIASAFNGRLYLLDPALGELTVTTDDYGTREWFHEGQANLPDGIIDMVIDGSIHLLADDGSLTRLADGNVIEEARPGFARPMAVDLGRMTGQFYIAGEHEGVGWLSLYDRSSGGITNLALPPERDGQLTGPGHDAFLALSSFAVDEAGGTIYWIGDGAIWSAQLPTAVSS